MNEHKNARLTPRGRERIVELVASGQTPKAVSEAVGVCPRTVRKWVDRHRREGLVGLHRRRANPERFQQAKCNSPMLCGWIANTEECFRHRSELFARLTASAQSLKVDHTRVRCVGQPSLVSFWTGVAKSPGRLCNTCH